jgi:hypothetical protein
LSVCARCNVGDQRHVLCKQGTFKVHHLDWRRDFSGKQVENLVLSPDTSGRAELDKVVCQQFRNPGAIAAHCGIKQGFFRTAQVVGDIFRATHLFYCGSGFKYFSK